MNSSGAVQGEQFEILSVNKINPTPINPRTLQLKSEKFQELAESVRAAGVKTPVLVRPAKSGRFELMDGHRRLAACKEVGRKNIPAVIYRGISDQEAFEITFQAFFNRKDLTPLEEGKAATLLLEKYKGDAVKVAAKLGKSIQWITTRANINKSLSKKWRDALSEGGTDIDNLTAGHLALIARLPKDLQDGLFGRSWEELTIGQLDELISEKLWVISKAPFSIADAGLVPRVGACTKCKKRSSVAPELWDKIDSEGMVTKIDRCLDPKCWATKKIARIMFSKKELLAVHPKLAFITTAHTSGQEDRDLSQNFREFKEKGRWQKAAQSAKGAIPAMVIHGPGVGSLKWIAGPGSGASGSSRAAVSGSKQAPKGKPLKERRKLLDSKRWQQVLRKMVELVKVRGIEQLTCGADDRSKFIVMAAATFGTIKNLDSIYNVIGWKDFAKNYAQIKAVHEVQSALWSQVRPVLAERLVYNGPITQVPKRLIDEAKIVAGHLGIDVDELYAEQVKAIPEPKTWANLNADGTAKKATKKKAKKAKDQENVGRQIRGITRNPSPKKTAKEKTKKRKVCELHS